MADFGFIEDKDLKEKVENAHKLDVDDLTIKLTDAAKTQVEEAVTGLKDKNTELLGEKKAVDVKLKAFDGYDPKTLKISSDFYEKNKNEEFMKEGTIDELVEKRTSLITSDFETQIGELNTNLEASKKHGANYQTLFESKTIDDGVREAALKSGMLPTAVEDAVLRGRSIFSLDEKKQIEARDSEGKLAVTEDKKVLTTQNWIEGLKVTSPHYWPNSESANAHGKTGGDQGDYMAKLAAFSDAGDMEGYRKFRDSKKKK